MFKKKPIYIILLIIFSLVLLADSAVYFAVPEGSDVRIMQNFAAASPKQELPENADIGAMPAMRQENNFLSFVKSAFVPIFTVCVLADLCCIFMLVLLKKRGTVKSSPENTAQKNEARKTRRKRKLWVIPLAAVLAAAAVIAVLPARKSSGGSISAQESVISGTADTGNIASSFYGSGTLEDAQAENITIPGSVELTGYTVKNGDVIEEGDAVAEVDRTSVMKTIAEVQEAIDELDAEIENAGSQSISSAVRAHCSGRVKVVYAEEGKSVVDTMYEHGALMLISLDGCMAVDVQSGISCTAGESVSVMLSDGSEKTGKIIRSDGETVTVTLTDEGTAYGEEVTVLSLDGQCIGSGSLHINSELKITGFSGTVSDICVSEESTVCDGKMLLTLTDTDITGEYRQLLKEREELAEQMLQLAVMYRDGCVYAQCGGIVSGLDSDAVYIQPEEDASAQPSAADTAAAGSELLSTGSMQTNGITLLGTNTSVQNGYTMLLNSGGESAASPAPSVPGENTDVKYAGKVTAVSYGVISMMVTESPVGDIGCSELESYDAGLFTQEAQYSPDASVEVYVYENGESLPSSMDKIKAGDIMLLSFKNDSLVRMDCIPQKEEQDDTDHPADEPAGPQGPGGGMPQEPGGETQTDSGEGSSIKLPSSGNSASSQTETSEERYSISEQTVCSVTPNDIMTVSVSADELDVLSLAEGQQATVTLDAVSKKSFEGVITSIDPIGVNEGGSTKYTVELELSRTENMLGGMNASVRIITGNTENAVIVPAAALNEKGNEVYIYTDYDEKTDTLSSPVTVTTGASDGENVEITDGMESGSSFYYRFADALVYTFG